MGAGYGDGGQHGQALWGMLAAIPGLTVVVPSTPADAAGLMAAAIESDDPVVFMEHKLLSELWLDSLGRGGRETVSFDVPPEGAAGEVPDPLEPIPFGRAVVRRQGEDVTVASVAVGVHRALAAAEELAGAGGPSCEVIDLRSLRPLDIETVVESVGRTGRHLVGDEDYREYGLSGELAAVSLEAGLTPRFGRVCVEDTLPYARHLEDAALPNPDRIAAAARRLVED
jgi:pyruvate dehydrogenase E1 component beta subunit